MLQRAILVILVVLALTLWAGLATFMNHRPPSAANRVVFLAIWGAAIACTAIPPAYVANARVRGYLGRRWSLGQAASGDTGTPQEQVVGGHRRRGWAVPTPF